MEVGSRCSASCEFFRCGQKALQLRGSSVFCRLGDDLCEGSSCKYVICVRNRLLNDGICGLTVKRLSPVVETPPEEVNIPIKLKGRLGRMRDVDLY